MRDRERSRDLGEPMRDRERPRGPWMGKSPPCPGGFPGAGRLGGDKGALRPGLGRGLAERVTPEELNVPLEGRTGGWSKRKRPKKKKNKARREVVLASGFDFIELEASVKCDLT